MSATPLCSAPSCDHLSPNGFLCPGCVRILDGDLRAVPDLLAELDITISRQDHLAGDGSFARTSEIPLPLRLSPLEVKRDLVETMFVWAAHMALERRSQLAALIATESSAAWSNYLLERLCDVVLNPSAGQLANEVGYMVKVSRRAVDRPAQLRYVGPCDACGFDLYAHPWAPDIKCDGCAEIYAVDQRREWLLDQAELYLLTATEMSRALPGLLARDTHGREPMLTAAMIRGWAFRGRIFRYPAHPARPNEPLYRVGDVLDLVNDLQKQDLAS